MSVFSIRFQQQRPDSVLSCLSVCFFKDPSAQQRWLLKTRLRFFSFSRAFCPERISLCMYIYQYCVSVRIDQRSSEVLSGQCCQQHQTNLDSIFMVCKFTTNPYPHHISFMSICRNTCDVLCKHWCYWKHKITIKNQCCRLLWQHTNMAHSVRVTEEFHSC